MVETVVEARMFEVAGMEVITREPPAHHGMAKSSHMTEASHMAKAAHSAKAAHVATTHVAEAAHMPAATNEVAAHVAAPVTATAAAHLHDGERVADIVAGQTRSGRQAGR
jgi:hypothetical protein